MKVSSVNKWKLLGFCLIMGGFAGLIIWLFLKFLSIGTGFLWETLPEIVQIPFYPIVLCGLAGVLAGIVRKKYGDYPEELSVVMGKVKNEKHYDYSKMGALMVLALIPLLAGASVGPEAGLTGIIVGICYWVGDNLKSAKKEMGEYSEIGSVVTLGILFHSPLFGIFESIECENGNEEIRISGSSKLLLYGISLASAMGVNLALSYFFGGNLGGLPSFNMEGDLILYDYFMIVPYILAGILLAAFYNLFHEKCKIIMNKFPSIVSETIAGILVGIAAIILPVILFSGEEELLLLVTDFSMYSGIAWMGIALLKIILTCICICGGMKGGHFFPLIFAGASFGFGLSYIVFQGGGHEVFAAAVVTAAMLGCSLKKPLAVTMLLILCFPPRICIWIFVSAVIGGRIFTKLFEAKSIRDRIQEET